VEMDKEWDIPNEYLIEMGRLSVRWSRLETLIEFSMIELLGKSPLEGRSLVLFTHMTFPQKMDIMGALIVECLLNPQYQWLSRYKVDVAPLLKDAASKRNTIIHAKWMLDPDDCVWKSAISARGTLKMERTRGTIRELEDASKSIVKAGERLVALVFRKQLSSIPQSGQ
jgi:hypothetical protein